MEWSKRNALVAALVVVACAPAVPAARTAPVVSTVDVPLHARILRMTDAREPDSAVVADALASAVRATRAAGVLAIGQLRARQWTSTLRELLADPDTAVAANAAYALGLMRDTASADRLANVLGRSVVGAEAAWALGQMGDPARQHIARALSAGVADERTLGELLLAASWMRPVPQQVEPLLRHSSAEVRWRAAYAFARRYAPNGARPLLGARADPAPRVRTFVARGLSLVATGDSLADSAVAALRELARDSHPHVRINALRALGTHGASAADLALELARDRDANVRIAAAEVAGAAFGAGASAWPLLWSLDTGFTYRQTLLASAARAGAELTALRDWGTLDWPHRLAAAGAAASSPSAELRWELARTLADDDDERVRAAALTALAAAGGDTLANVRSLLRDRAARGALWERTAALMALANRPRPEDAEDVIAAYRRALDDTVGNARVAAARHLAALWEQDSLRLSPETRVRIRALPEPTDDPVARAAVGGQPPFDGWRTTPGTAGPLDWYEERVRELVAPAVAGRLARVAIDTERGTVTVELFAGDAPLTAHNFMTLARAGYYDGVVFHRVIPNFVAQDGDPTGTGAGGPGHVIRDELNRRRYDRGTVGMALSGPDTGGSQYFIAHSPQPHLDGGYTVFGRVVDGLDVLDALVQGDMIRTIRPR